MDKKKSRIVVMTMTSFSMHELSLPAGGTGETKGPESNEDIDLIHASQEMYTAIERNIYVYIY